MLFSFSTLFLISFISTQSLGDNCESDADCASPAYCDSSFLLCLAEIAIGSGCDPTLSDFYICESGTVCDEVKTTCVDENATSEPDPTITVSDIPGDSSTFEVPGDSVTTTVDEVLPTIESMTTMVEPVVIVVASSTVEPVDPVVTASVVPTSLAVVNPVVTFPVIPTFAAPVNPVITTAAAITIVSPVSVSSNQPLVPVPTSVAITSTLIVGSNPIVVGSAPTPRIVENSAVKNFNIFMLLVLLI